MTAGGTSDISADTPVTPSVAVAPMTTPEVAAAPTPSRFKLTIAYDGHEFHGWQKQCPPGGEPLRTVAGVVEGTLQRVLGEPINLVGASRTDAGVHALGQVAHFDAVCRVPLARLAQAINARLPGDVEVRHAEKVSGTFDAIRGARRKQYRYRLHNVEQRPLERRFHVYHCWTPLDLDAMNAAAALFVGEHDFEAFAAAGHNRQSTVRTIFHCDVARDRDGREVHITVEGNGFLYNMVRIIAGTLVEVGRGRFRPEQVTAALASRDRRDAGPTLPPEGLWLMWIEYGDGAGAGPSPLPRAEEHG